MACAFWNSARASCKSPLFRAFSPCSTWNWPSVEAHLGGAQLVFGVGGVGSKGALVVNERRIVVLHGFGLAAGFEVLICLGAASQEDDGKRKDWQTCFNGATKYPPQKLLESCKV